MTYEIIFTDSAKKEFLKLEKCVQIRISKALERISVRPEAFLEKLSGIESYKFRVGKYRIIIDLEKDKLILLVIKVGLRKNIYDNLN